MFNKTVSINEYTVEVVDRYRAMLDVSFSEMLRIMVADYDKRCNNDTTRGVSNKCDG